ncbi:MAG: hypothetical protein ABFD98_19275 [Syntrophobacteraceae bacterium]|nr:hypothetical protein [Desulfobacteraceae bacterium]
MSDTKSTQDTKDDPSFDLESFSQHIDSEIDKLFVPAEVEAEETPSTEALEIAPDITPIPDTPASSAKPADFPTSPQTSGAADGGLDLEAFDALIDREIDNLFVPSTSMPSLDEPGLPETPAGSRTFSPKTAQAPAEAAFSPSPSATASDRSFDTTAYPPLAADNFETRPADPELSRQQQIELLLDPVNAAYLSLDWEFSSDNARKYETAVAKLESYARKSTAATSLFKMLQSTARRMRVHPDQTGRDVTEFFRDAHELLGPVLLSQGPLAGPERDRIKKLIERFKTMRQQVVQSQEATTKTPEAGFSSSAIPAPPQAQPSLRHFTPAEACDAAALKTFREWMEHEAARMDQGVSSLSEEALHLSEIEAVLARTRALAPLTTRLTGIRRNIEQHLAVCRQASQEWPARVDWLRRLENSLSMAADLSAGAPGLQASSTLHQPSETGASSSVETRSERLCLFSLSGKIMAVPASQVVKTSEASPKKAFKILNRGYATLADFKPFLKSLKSGLSGNWKEMPTNTLKGLRFHPLRYSAVDDSSGAKPVGGAILVSEGSRYGIIFTDLPPAEFVDNAEIIMDGSAEKDVLGFILNDSGTPIEVLNLDCLLGEQQ